ncbi:MAG: LytR C-terminal domain-containing protein [Ilumatobacteraceae bacterium]
MTDVDGSEQMPRRSGRVGDGGAPVSGAVAIVLAVVAVVAGFLILNSLSGDNDEQADFPAPGNTADGGDPSADGTVDQSTDAGGSADPTLPPPVTAPPLATGVPIIVANANGQGGSAGKVTAVLETGAGFDTVQATNANTQVSALEASVIYFDPAQPEAQAVAESLSRVLGGGLSVQPIPEVAPISDGDLRGAGVLLMLGMDFADVTVEQLTLPDAAAATPTVSNPDTGGTPSSTTG